MNWFKVVLSKIKANISKKYPDDLAGFIHREVMHTSWVKIEFKTGVVDFLQKIPHEYKGIVPKNHNFEQAISNYNKDLNASDILFAIYKNASSKHNFYANLKRFKEKCGDTEFEYVAACDERDCSWCRMTSGKIFTIETDIIFLIEKNCTCLYSRAIPLPAANW